MSIRAVIERGRFSETAELIMGGHGLRSEGEFSPGDTHSTSIRLVTAPMTVPGQDATLRNETPAGVRRYSERKFWTVSHPQPVRVGDVSSRGDIIRYRDVEYSIVGVSRYRGLTEITAVEKDQ